MAAGRTVAAVVMVMALVGCAAPLPFARPTPTPRVVDCAALAKKGVRPCPPDWPALDNPRVVNRTQGRVPEATVQRWARAFLRTLAYENWAVAHNSDQLLKAGILSTSEHVQLVFGFDIKNIEAAKSAHGKLEVVNSRIVEIDVVAVPSDLRQGLSDEGYHAQDHALVVHISGASRIDLVSGETSKTLVSVGSDGKADQFEWGRESQHSPLGLVWVLDGITACASDPAFKALCGQ